MTDMFEQYFGLRENPFRVNPDPRYLFFTPSAQKALDGLTYGIQSRKGILLLTGEVGTGKTTLLNTLLDWLRLRKSATAFLFNTQLTVNELLDCLLADFGVPGESRIKSDMLIRLNTWLLERYRAGETAVLVVDEAQNLSSGALEEIRLLTNLETSSEKLLQVVLCGQPELREKLKQPQLRQLLQRIIVRCKTTCLSLQETQGYIAERLRIAGANGRAIFSSEALESIHKYSEGIPRLINMLCERALIGASIGQQRPILASAVDEAAREFELEGIEPDTACFTGLRYYAGSRPGQSALQDAASLLDQFRQHAPVPQETGENRL